MANDILNKIRGAGYPILPSTSVESNWAVAEIKDKNEAIRILDDILKGNQVLTVKEHDDRIGDDRGKWAYVLLKTGALLRFKNQLLD